jgi:hypothetical protein
MLHAGGTAADRAWRFPLRSPEAPRISPTAQHLPPSESPSARRVTPSARRGSPGTDRQVGPAETPDRRSPSPHTQAESTAPGSQEQSDRSIADILAELDRQSDGRALAQIESYLVRQIRTYRPDVIVIGASPAGRTPEDELTEQLVLSALEAAADPTRHIDLVTDAGLAAWQVQRVFANDEDIDDARMAVTGSSFVSHLGRTVGEIAEEARGVLAIPSLPPSSVVALRQLYPHGEFSGQVRHVFSGMELPPGGDARRAAAPVADGLVQQAASEAQQRRSVQAILANQVGSPALAGHLSSLTEGLNDTSQARVLHDLAEGYRSDGNYYLAAETLHRLVQDHPQDTLVDAAAVWLIQYYAGSETLIGGEGSEFRDQGPGTRGQGSGFRVQSSGFRVQGSGFSGQGSSPVSTPLPLREGLGEGPAFASDSALPRSVSAAEKAIEIARLVAQLRPNLVREPPLGVPLAAAYRRRGLANEADRYMLLLRQRGAADAWQQLAETERWLADPQNEPPTLPIWTCKRTSERPHLDGHLDEAFWQSVRPIVAGAEEPRRTELRLAYDHEFLYLASHAPQPQTARGDESYVTPRERDEDLAGHDRVHLAIDLDRDLTTYYELTLDHRGHVHEQAWHDPRWNPQWYVAHHGSETGWTIEAAIPLAELTSTPPQPRDVWCITAAHVAADGRTTAWHGPATPNPSPASFGLLIFD